MPKLINITGQRYGRLVVLERSGTYTPPGDPFSPKPVWRCKCDCGKVVEVIGTNLKSGLTRSCGCLRKEYGRENALHGKLAEGRDRYILKLRKAREKK